VRITLRSSVNGFASRGRSFAATKLYVIASDRPTSIAAPHAGGQVERRKRRHRSDRRRDRRHRGDAANAHDLLDEIRLEPQIRLSITDRAKNGIMATS
jgi:hypothetical protein